MRVSVSATSSTRSCVKRCSLNDPVGPPSPLVPLSEISRTSVSSSRSVARRKSSTRPIWASVWVTKPANTSMNRA